MKNELYDAIHTSELGWWYRERTRMIGDVLRMHVGKNQNMRILDYGAGYGALTATLRAYGVVDAIENHPPCKTELLTRGCRHVYESSDALLACSKNTPYDLVTFFDVLEHLRDDRDVLGIIRKKLLATDGYVVATVPAYQFLYGLHDLNAKHYRRYTRRGIVRTFKDAGLQIVFASYWNSFLLPVAIVMRIFGTGGGESLRQPKILDTLLGSVLSLETRILRYASLPFGLSIVVVGRKERAL